MSPEAPAAIFATRGTDGSVSALPPSLQWPAKKPHTAVPPDLEICEGNWKMAEDVANNWTVETGLSLAAREKWPLRIAVGKLNVVFAEGKEPRLVLDSTVCHVNKMPFTRAPQASDLALSTQPDDISWVQALTSKPLTNRCRSALKSMAFY